MSLRERHTRASSLASRAPSSSLRIAKRVVESTRGVPRAGRVCEPRRVARSRKSKGRGRSQPRTFRFVRTAGGRASELVDGRHQQAPHTRLVDNTPVAEHAGVHASMVRYNSFISIAAAAASTPEYSHHTPFIYDLCTDDSHPPPPPPRKGLQHALYFFPDAHGHGLLAGNAPSNDAASAFLSSGVTLS